MMKIEVSALHVYPVKSLPGISLQSARLEPTGLAGDRQWMVVDDNGRFVSQRNTPAMALMGCELGDNQLVLHAPDHPPLALPLEPSTGQHAAISVWRDKWQALDAGDDAARWISGAIGQGRALRLVRADAARPRTQSQPDRYGPHTTTHFADGAPYLVAGADSLDRLNDSLSGQAGGAVDMRRFRPNIVVTGLPAFEEHATGRLQGPGYDLELRYPCQRCVITTIDPDTAIADPAREPFRTLATLNPMPGNPRAPAFGENAILVSGAGATIRVGDMLTALPRKT
ncbi:MOSC domain-containing protein [Marinihelvus fidelis]|uniref:MOSC domain-containing protein n=1 Tax=Marinihelvus fidelis TaxID=2613842 RepID=A0A5N0TER9_9GAMM|nr:MOSC N-terminal beta barrel domain-containing protein [Marinihelvus fidelis]KAA9132597.1 MOSC domain-containing protein [Marinihelvus fidelis]